MIKTELDKIYQIVFSIDPMAIIQPINERLRIEPHTKLAEIELELSNDEYECEIDDTILWVDLEPLIDSVFWRLSHWDKNDIKDMKALLIELKALTKHHEQYYDNIPTEPILSDLPNVLAMDKNGNCITRDFEIHEISDLVKISKTEYDELLQLEKKAIDNYIGSSDWDHIVEALWDDDKKRYEWLVRLYK